MKKIFITLSILMLLTLSFGSFDVVLAQGSGGASGTQVTGSGGASSDGLTNPLKVSDPREIIGNVIRAILGIVGSLALAVFVFGGFTWITSAGNDEKVKKGKDMITWAAFGLVVIFLSYALVTFVITALTGGSSSSNSGGGGSTQQFS